MKFRLLALALDDRPDGGGHPSPPPPPPSRAPTKRASAPPSAASPPSGTSSSASASATKPRAVMADATTRGYGGREYGDDAYDRDYDAVRYYRDDPRYQERVLTADDRVYRGSDGRYYCRRSDGTTGLVIGAGAGALIGRGIDGGRNRAGGTIVGGVLGALIGREIERSNDQVRCR